MKNTLCICRLKNIFIATLLCLSLTPTHSVQACGWWGDGDVNRDVDAVLTSFDGKPLPQILSTNTSKLPGRMGYGIAMLHIPAHHEHPFWSNVNTYSGGT
ncbi:MAG: hypothetical protein RPU61_13935 [Candidatus Sedimenticola sp. (ex Thyasira tokunagai)]